VTRYLRKRIEVPYYIYQTLYKYITLPQVTYYQQVTTSLKLYRRFQLYLRVIIRDLVRMKVITYQLYARVDRLVTLQKIQVERQVKSRALTNGWLVAELNKLVTVIKQLGYLSRIPNSACIMVSGQRLCGLYERVSSKQGAAVGQLKQRVFVQDKVFSRVIHTQQPAQVTLLKKTEDTVVFLKKQTHFLSTTKTVTPLLRKQVMASVRQRLALPPTGGPAWTQLVVQYGLDKLVSMIREELQKPEVKQQRKTLEKDLIVKAVEEEPVVTKEIVRMSVALQVLADDQLKVLLTGDLDYFN
jgi:hypothetical protein